uniref:head GIN domain-containing protein n=1 Tax=Polaribacter sp. TaxID=1920175 RepID=UPI0040487694
MKKMIISCLILTISYSAQAQNWWGNSKTVRGNGKVVTETRKTSDYDGISIGGSFDVVLVKGKEGKITLKGESNILDYIETEVSGSTLKVKYKSNVDIRTTRKLIVTIPYRDIDKVSLGGSGNITSEGTIKTSEMALSLGGSGEINIDIDTKELKTSIGGSGNINISGKAKEMTCSIAGSGSIRAYDLKTAVVTANIAGSGSINATVSDEINARLVGSGNIYYKGNPKKIKSKSVGSGNIIDRN